MSLSLIVAVGENGVIGLDGDLPWRLPADLKRFKKRTMGKPILMGRKTHESIGRPLPGRPNWVLTRYPHKVHQDCVVLSHVDEIKTRAKEEDEVMVIGGAEIYKALLPVADKLFLTAVHAQPQGDTFFPGLIAGDWIVEEKCYFPKDDKNEFAQTELVLRRRHYNDNMGLTHELPKVWWQEDAS
jgi:dihydrofolate reductase